MISSVETAINRIINGLIANDYVFVTPELSIEQMHKAITEYDKTRLLYGGKLFGFLLGGQDMPEFAQKITKQVISFSTQSVENTDLEKLQQLMQSNFPLCAFAFSKLYGPRFTAVIDGDNLNKAAYCNLINQFQQINLSMIHLGGRMLMKVLGQKIIDFNTSSGSGSLIIISSTTLSASKLLKWANSQPIHSDTMLNQLKGMAGRWQFWAKLLVGMIEFKPHQLRQEVIIVDAQANKVTSTISPRVTFEFGFPLNDIH